MAIVEAAPGRADYDVQLAFKPGLTKEGAGRWCPRRGSHGWRSSRSIYCLPRQSELRGLLDHLSHPARSALPASRQPSATARVPVDGGARVGHSQGCLSRPSLDSSEQARGDARMTRQLLRHVAFMGLLAVSPSTSQAQEPVGATALRIRWEVDPPVHGLQTVCGRVSNDGPVDARRVRVRVEGLDERGGVTARRDGEVLGRVSSRGIGRFCLTTSAGAATYRVTIVGVEWVAGPEAP
jgi:hypothetical protein